MGEDKEAALPDQEFKASLISYLAHDRTAKLEKMTGVRWCRRIGSTRGLNEYQDGAKGLINIYEERMLWAGQDGCDSCKYRSTNPCSD